ncbi:MAG: MFS transporter, partial [Robiginitalea sp.]
MKKRALSFWEIWNMSFGFLGIQFGFALQNANTSRIFETLGADVESIPILWIAAPVTGLIVQPIIGYFSDRTWNRLGRRRPYFLVGAILASIALCIMPNSPALWVAAGMLWIMDASINVSMEPFRAFVGDNLPSDQRTLGFAMQSFFIGVGAVVGSVMPYVFTNWLGISNTAPEGIIPDSVKWSFYVGAAVFFLAVLWTIVRSREYSPEELEAFAENKEAAPKPLTPEADAARVEKLRFYGLAMTALGILSTLLPYYYGLQKELYILTVGILLVGVLFLLAAYVRRRSGQNGFVIIMTDLLYMPKTMKELAWVQFFSWFALFSMWIYTTQAVTGHVYGTSDTTSQLYNDGADWVTVLFAV